MKTQLDMDKIARGLGAERSGKVSATGGYFGAMQLVADIEARFRVPAGAEDRRTLAGRSGGSSRWRLERSSAWKRSPQGSERAMA